MAKEFAKKFYHSKAWQQTRAYIFKKYDGLCHECGAPGEEVHHITELTSININDPYIALNESNLVLLCFDCHQKQHRRNKNSNNYYTFDEDGNPVVRD